MWRTVVAISMGMAGILLANEKIYLAPEQVTVTDEAIYAQLEDDFVEIDALMTDQGGIYVTVEHLRCSSCRQSLIEETHCHKRLNPKNTCHKRLNPKNTCTTHLAARQPK